MERWSRQQFNLPLSALSRFDAIFLLGFGAFDGLFPRKPIEELTGFFNYWGIDIAHTPGLNLELGRKKEKARRPCALFLRCQKRPIS